MATQPTVCRSFVIDGETALFITIENGNDQRVVQGIFNQPDLNLPVMKKQILVLPVFPTCAENDTSVIFFEKLQQAINSLDNIGKRTLDQARRVEAKWSDLPILQDKTRNDYSSSITNIPFNWIAACENGQLYALNSFIVHHCTDVRKFFEDQNDTPLHHIQLKTEQEYKELIENPLFKEMINALDFKHATPLHRALERQDMLFAEVLLTSDRVDLFAKDKKGKAATDLLADLCNQSCLWDAMCKRTGIDQWLKPAFIQQTRVNIGGSRAAYGYSTGASSMSQMRETLVVVAALLATLTFAAAFTLPGGYNNNTGDAILAKKTSFIVFIIADAYAMCCAMLVLFCLIATIAGDNAEAMKRVKRTKFILIQSLYGTLVAFAAAVFTVIADKSLWSAIVIFVMCSLVAMSANNPVVCNLLDRISPIADYVDEIDDIRSRQKRKKRQTRRLKRGTVAAAHLANSSIV